MYARAPIVCLLLAASLSRGVAQEALPSQARPASGSLSAGFETALATQEWRRAEFEFPIELLLHDGTVLPVWLALQDLETGEEVRLSPAVWFEVDGRQRWGGRSLETDWLLVMDAATGPVHRTAFSIQLKAAAPRFLRLTAGVQMELAGWHWRPTDGEARRLNRTELEISDSLPTPLGARGERARAAGVALTRTQREIVLQADTGEPRLFDLVARPAENFFGIIYETALSPHTRHFPGRAAFRFSIESRNPEAQAGDDAGAGAAPASSPRAPLESPRGDDVLTRISDTPYPLVFAPRIRGTDALGAPAAWTPIPFTLSDEPSGMLDATESALPDHDMDALLNFARDARVRITAPTSDLGAELDALADGITTDGDGWRSTDAAVPHRIHLDLPAPTALHELVIHWPMPGDMPRTPRALRVSGYSAAGAWIAWPDLAFDAPVETTRVELGSAQLRRLTLELPAGGGPDGDPNRLWIWELEVR